MKKALASVVTIALLFCTLQVFAEGEQQLKGTHRAEMYFSAHTRSINYSNKYGRTDESYIVATDDGGFTVVSVYKTVNIETYDKDFKLTGFKSIDFELPMFGAFFSGEKYNYIVYGQENENEDKEEEVIRIVKYDKSYKRLGSVSLSDIYTIKPFDFGSTRLAENGNILVLHTSRLRYLTPDDGLNHQSQFTAIINTDDMSVLHKSAKFPPNHVSHSFDQYALFAGGQLTLLDHGDGYPRSVVISTASVASQNAEDYKKLKFKKTDLFKIPGEIGANETGVSVGGFTATSTSFLVGINSYFDKNGKKNSDSYRDIYILRKPLKDDGEIASTSLLAKYSGDERMGSVPRLIKINDNKVMALWEEKKSGEIETAVKYVYLDENGEMTSSIESIEGYKLSAVYPVLQGDKVVWYRDNDGDVLIRTFYTIQVK